MIPRTPPRPHQVEAVQAITNTLINNARVQYIAACGTGKTLVGLHAAESQNPRSAIVFLPSLALIRQTVCEWSMQSMFGANYDLMIVCSDPTITQALDEIEITEDDLGTPITTNHLLIKSFLETPSQKTKVVFSTYYSARVVANGIPSGFCFDFGILDEAHKTAGEHAKLSGIVLHDNQIPIKRRLSLTATPRHFKIRHKATDQDRLIYSMDSLEHYGPVASRLTFSRAVEQDLICDYSALISVITSSEIRERFLQQKTNLIIEDRKIDTRRLANLIAIQNAVEKYNLKKLITFHGSIQEASDFIQLNNPSIEDYLPGFKFLHVNGSMSSFERNKIMDEFKRSEKAIISNARCLTEGVDIPSIDCCIFIVPKSSQVDIVQAIGRASRKSNGKKRGYVLLPLFVDDLETGSTERAIKESKFSFIWTVINALKEEDEVLDSVIEHGLSEMRCRGNGYLPDFGEKLQIIGSSADIQELTRNIKTVCIETIGSEFSEMLGGLKGFVDKYHHCDIPDDYEVNGKNLKKWVFKQRIRRNSHKLNETEILRLEEAGMVWSAKEAYFYRRLNDLADYFQKHGHSRVPRWTMVDGFDLGQWAADQRNAFGRGDLTEVQIQRLNQFNFVWNAMPDNFDQYFEELVKFKNLFGHCNVPRNYLANGIKLGHWISNIRRKYRLKAPTLTPERIARLKAIGFQWSDSKRLFTYDQIEKVFKYLEKYRVEHGNLRVPATFKYNDFLLGSIVLRIRKDRKNNRPELTPDLIECLDKIGFVWNVAALTRHERKNEVICHLKNYKAIHGHCRVPIAYKINGFPLGAIVHHFRKDRVNNHPALTPDIIAELDEIGFDWGKKKKDIILEPVSAASWDHSHLDFPIGLESYNSLNNSEDSLEF